MRMTFLKLVVISILFVSCNLKKNTDIILFTKQYSIKDLTEFKLELYEINVKINPILDSIIEDVNSCARYKNAQIGFVYTVYQDSINRMVINIENTTNIYQFDYSLCNGVFYYNGYQFLHIGIINETLFKNLNQKMQLYGIRNEKLKTMYKGNDEFFHSSWGYIYDGKDFKCVNYNVCGNFWNADN